MANQRDDFSVQVKELLAKRVGISEISSQSLYLRALWGFFCQRINRGFFQSFNIWGKKEKKVLAILRTGCFGNHRLSLLNLKSM